MKTLQQFLEEFSDHDTTFSGIHYSKSPNLTELSGARNGTGIKGQEDQRVLSASDPRLRNRVYFYRKPENGYPRPEAGLGTHMYSSTLDNIYDGTKGNSATPIVNAYRVARTNSGEGNHSNAFESAILDAGFDGYKIHDMAVVLNRNVPVKYLGVVDHASTVSIKPPVETTKRSMFTSPYGTDGTHESGLLDASHHGFLRAHMDTLKKNAPSARMMYGRFTVHKDHLGELKRTIDAIGGAPHF